MRRQGKEVFLIAETVFREVKFLEDGDEEFVEECLDWRHGRYNVNWSSDGS